MFRVRILPDSLCHRDNETVMVHLPTDVAVSARGLVDCDPGPHVIEPDPEEKP